METRDYIKLHSMLFKVKLHLVALAYVSYLFITESTNCFAYVS